MSKVTEANKARAIEWAEYVLPIWEKRYPNDDRPRRAVEAAKAKDTDAYAAYYTHYTAYAHAAHPAHAARSAAANAAADHASAAFAAHAAARAAAYAAYAAHAAAYAAHAAASAADSVDYAAHAILLERYGKDIVKVRKVLLLQDCIDFESIKWLDYKPEQFWDVMLEQYCRGK